MPPKDVRLARPPAGIDNLDRLAPAPDDDEGAEWTLAYAEYDPFETLPKAPRWGEDMAKVGNYAWRNADLDRVLTEWRQRNGFPDDYLPCGDEVDDDETDENDRDAARDHFIYVARGGRGRPDAMDDGAWSWSDRHSRGLVLPLARRELTIPRDASGTRHGWLVSDDGVPPTRAPGFPEGGQPGSRSGTVVFTNEELSDIYEWCRLRFASERGDATLRQRKRAPAQVLATMARTARKNADSLATISAVRELVSEAHHGSQIAHDRAVDASRAVQATVQSHGETLDDLRASAWPWHREYWGAPGPTPSQYHIDAARAAAATTGAFADRWRPRDAILAAQDDATLLQTDQRGIVALAEEALRHTEAADVEADAAERAAAVAAGAAGIARHRSEARGSVGTAKRTRTMKSRRTARGFDGRKKAVERLFGSTRRGGRRSALTKGRLSALTKGRRSALTTGRRSALTKGRCSALTNGRRSALTKGRRSALTKGPCSALTKGRCSALTNGRRSALTKGRRSALTKGRRSALTKGRRPKRGN